MAKIMITGATGLLSRALVKQLKLTDALANAAKLQGAWVLYISTDYVFDGTAPSYDELDRPNPVNFYGESKLRGEQALLGISSDFAVLRLPILYGEVEHVGESAILVLLDQRLDNTPQDVDNWAVRSPTLTQDIAIAIEQMIVIQLGGGSLRGIYHFSAKQTMSKYQMLLVFGELLGVDCAHLTPVSSPMDTAKIPHDCTLSCQRLAGVGIVPQIDFKQGIKQSLANSQNALSSIGVELN